MQSDFLLAIRQIEREREIPPEEIQNIVEDAITKAYQQESEGLQSIRVEFDPETGRLNIYQVREAVEEVRNPALEIDIESALQVNDEIVPGELVETAISLRSFRRIGIQSVKQHIIQRVKDLEKNIQLERFMGREGQIITGDISRITSNGVLVNLGRIEGLLQKSERIPGEKYAIGKRVKVLILELRTGLKDSEIMLSRSHPDFVKRLFELEVPEISQNIVQIKEIVREAGYRTKMAVLSTQDKVDPVGACVGFKGSRVKNIVNELNGEKIDIIPWDEDPAQFIAHALSPAQVISVEIFDDHSAEVIVPDNQLSLAIGKQGQNARLANKLTTWKIDILSESEKDRLTNEIRHTEILSAHISKLNLYESTETQLFDLNMNTIYDLICFSGQELENEKGLSPGQTGDIILRLAEHNLKLREHDAPIPPSTASLKSKYEESNQSESEDEDTYSDEEIDSDYDEENTTGENELADYAQEDLIDSQDSNPEEIESQTSIIEEN